MSKAFLLQQILQTVELNTRKDGQVSLHDVKALERYLRTPDVASLGMLTVSLTHPAVYLQVIQRVQETRKHNFVEYLPILEQCIALMKRNMVW